MIYYPENMRREFLHLNRKPLNWTAAHALKRITLKTLETTGISFKKRISKSLLKENPCSLKNKSRRNIMKASPLTKTLLTLATIILSLIASPIQAELRLNSVSKTLGVLGEDLENVTLTGTGFDENTVSFRQACMT